MPSGPAPTPAFIPVATHGQHHPNTSLEDQRDLAREVFEELRVREGRLMAVKPRSSYPPLFAYNL